MWISWEESNPEIDDFFGKELFEIRMTASTKEGGKSEGQYPKHPSGKPFKAMGLQEPEKTILFWRT